MQTRKATRYIFISTYIAAISLLFILSFWLILTSNPVTSTNFWAIESIVLINSLSTTFLPLGFLSLILASILGWWQFGLMLLKLINPHLGSASLLKTLQILCKI